MPGRVAGAGQIVSGLGCGPQHGTKNATDHVSFGIRARKLLVLPAGVGGYSGANHFSSDLGVGNCDDHRRFGRLRASLFGHSQPFAIVVQTRKACDPDSLQEGDLR